MPGALETLVELRERFTDLPARVVDILRQQEPPLPMTPAAGISPLLPSAAFSATSQAVGELPQPTFAAGPSYDPPAPSSPGVSSMAPPIPSAPQMASLTPAMPSAASSSPTISGPISGQSETVSLLRQLVEGGGRGVESQQRPGRAPPPPSQLVWSGSWSADQEGYATASPSFDVSNRAGISGASSARGFGSNLRGHRYLQPDPEGEFPR